MEEYSLKNCILALWKSQSLNTTNIIPVLLLYRNQSTDFHCKSMEWCLFDCNTGWKWFNPNLGGLLGVRFEVGGGGGGHKITTLKPVGIMVETSNLARRYIPICSFRKYAFQCLGPLNFADVSIFLQKISIFCPKKYLSSKQ